jgi:hypothetical protein
VVGAVVGATLGSLLERNVYLNISDWLSSYFALQLIFLILAFAVLAHFYCAACHLNAVLIKRCSFGGCVLIIILTFFLYPRHLRIAPDASINFLPYEYNTLISGVLLLWLITL